MAGIRILLVDDNPFDRELATRALRELTVPSGQVDITTAGEWAEGQRLLDELKPDLLLLDYYLPGQTGLQILRALRGGELPPIVMLTGQADAETAVATLRAGAADYVQKSDGWPVALRVTIERVLDRAHVERELAAARKALSSYANELEQKLVTRTAVLRHQAHEIEGLYLKAEEAARLKEEFIANVSHELRTPLNAILGYSDVLHDVLAESGRSDARSMLGTVRTQADRLLELIESVLALGKLRQGSDGVVPSRFRLAAFAAELRADVLPLDTDKSLAIEVHEPREVHEIHTDRAKLRAIGYHLASNAIKFTPAGRVDVTATPIEGGGVRLTVCDTGIGLPTEARSVIFEDFMQLDGSATRRHGGLGLGLGIVRRYTALLQGTIRVDGAPGAGTTIVVEVPGYQPPVSAEAR